LSSANIPDNIYIYNNLVSPEKITRKEFLSPNNLYYRILNHILTAHSHHETLSATNMIHITNNMDQNSTHHSKRLLQTAWSIINRIPGRANTAAQPTAPSLTSHPLAGQ